jgi:hypothetical protein
LIQENIITTLGPTVLDGGKWGTPGTGAPDPIDNNAEMADDLEQRSPGQPEQDALQQFWAYGFPAPAGFSLPSKPALASGYPALTIPLIIKDGISTTDPGDFGTLGNVYTQSYIGINGDNGNAPNKYYIVRGNVKDPVAQTCGGP